MLLLKGSLVDDGRLPAAALAELADRESRQPQAIYKTHKWFARRLGTSMRALTVGLACGDDEAFWQMFHGARPISLESCWIHSSAAAPPLRRLLVWA
jgi:putative DNA methylase